MKSKLYPFKSLWGHHMFWHCWYTMSHAESLWGIPHSGLNSLLCVTLTLSHVAYEGQTNFSDPHLLLQFPLLAHQSKCPYIQVEVKTSVDKCGVWAWNLGWSNSHEVLVRLVLPAKRVQTQHASLFNCYQCSLTAWLILLWRRERRKDLTVARKIGADVFC